MSNPMRRPQLHPSPSSPPKTSTHGIHTPQQTIQPRLHILTLLVRMAPQQPRQQQPQPVFRQCARLALALLRLVLCLPRCRRRLQEIRLHAVIHGADARAEPHARRGSARAESRVEDDELRAADARGEEVLFAGVVVCRTGEVGVFAAGEGRWDGDCGEVGGVDFLVGVGGGEGEEVGGVVCDCLFFLSVYSFSYIYIYILIWKRRRE